MSGEGVPAATGGTGGTAGTGATAGTASGGSAGATGGSGGSGGSAGGPDACASGPALSKPRVWRLTNDQLKNTLRDQFGFVPPSAETLPTEARLEGFANRSNDLRISALLADGYYQVSEELAADVVARGSAYGIGCAIDAVTTGTCLSDFVTTFGKKMWRRPLTEAEVAGFASLYTTAAANGEGAAGGVKAIAQVLFLSPNFLHRSELGTNQTAGVVTPLTDYEIASALSYTLWDSAPDQALLDLAAQGRLREPSVLREQARRMFASDETATAMHHFVEQWLFIERLSHADKDLALFSVGTPDVAADLGEATRRFVSSVLFEPGGDRSFKTLFTAPYGFVNTRTAPVYGLSDVTSATLVRHDLNPAERRGILTQPAFMWAHADPDGTQLVTRGAYVRAELLCDPVMPPPEGVIQQVNFAPPDATGREKFEIHSSETCAGCHALFDSIGFAMESYDAIGRYRLTDKGKTIDPSGSIPLPNGSTVAFANFVELVDGLAKEPDLYACFSGKYLSYASGRRFEDLDACERKTVAERFVASDYKLDELVFTIVESPSFVDRRN